MLFKQQSHHKQVVAFGSPNKPSLMQLVKLEDQQCVALNHLMHLYQISRLDMLQEDTHRVASLKWLLWKQIVIP